MLISSTQVAQRVFVLAYITNLKLQGFENLEAF